MESALDKFIRLLQQRRLIEKADDFCASWLDAYIAQEADGRVFIYNGPIVSERGAWMHATPLCARNDRRFLGVLDPARAWQALSLPAAAFQLPQHALTHEQFVFFEKLLQSGIAETMQAFLNSWKCNCWIARDMSGSIFLYNHMPRIGPLSWHKDDPEIGLFHPLGTILTHDLDWQKCLVSLAEARRSIRLAATLEGDIPTMDCWI